MMVETLDSEYWLSVSNMEVKHIRPLASKYQIRRAISLIRKEPNELPKDYKLRGKIVKETLKDVSLYAKARMIRDLYGLMMARKLNETKQSALEKTKKYLLCELAVINGEEHKE